jgi:hypothetical protein
MSVMLVRAMLTNCRRDNTASASSTPRLDSPVPSAMERSCPRYILRQRRLEACFRLRWAQYGHNQELERKAIFAELSKSFSSVNFQ